MRLGIANQRVVVRTMRLPAIDDPDELDAAVRFEAQEQIPMPLDQAILDHRVVGGVAAAEERGAADRRRRRRRPPRHDRGLAEAAARRRPANRSGVDLSAFGLIRALGDATLRRATASRLEPPPTAILYCNVGDVTNLAVAKGRSCLFTRVSPVGLEDIAAEPRRQHRA